MNRAIILAVALALLAGSALAGAPAAAPEKAPPAPLCARLRWDATVSPPALVIDVACVPFRGPRLEVRVELDVETVLTASATATADRYAAVSFPLGAPMLRGITPASVLVLIVPALAGPPPPPAKPVPAAPGSPEMADRMKRNAADIQGLVAAADNQRQADKAHEARWLELAKSDDAAAITALVLEEADLPYVNDAKQRLAFLAKVAGTLSALSTAAATLPDNADEVAGILERLRPQARESAQADRELGRYGCLLAAATEETSPGFARAFAVLRERESAARWPCTAEQTDLVWTRFKRSFDADVEIRADFPGAYAYLARWHAVLDRFRVIAASLAATQAETALLAMLGKVERAARKLPPAEGCATVGSQRLLCGWVCDAKHRAGTRRCSAFKVEKARTVCEERGDAELAKCSECCTTEGKQCPAKRTLRCRPGETPSPEQPGESEQPGQPEPPEQAEQPDEEL